MPFKPESVGLSAHRLARIDRFIERQYIEPGKLKGALVAVVRRGEVAHLGVLGQADAERGRALKEDAIFRIYSMTKPLTSIAFMMLVEEGLVALDDPVSRFIPEWSSLGVYDGGLLQSFRTRPAARPMLIIDLLRHTSGLTYSIQNRTNVDAAYRELGLGDPGSDLDLDAMIAGLSLMPLEFSPGECWNYSVSTDVLGYLVGKISGRPFQQFLKERVIDPLRMIDTDFHVPAAKADRLAACYALGRRGVVLQDDPRKSPFLNPPVFYSGGGGLVSTARDYLRFCQMLLNGGQLEGARLVSPKTLELMGANHLPGGRDLASLSKSMFSEASYAGLGFGLGFATTIDPAATLIPGSRGDLSWGGAASTYFWVDPREQLSVVLMAQLLPSSSYPLRRELRTLVYSAFTESYG
ncbi:MAG: beta-lactamase family protein [Caulobacteraceae bacterium]|nr:beta-lactamase family protein [Caulobacteraceae bacterium]